jgi:hypothetical protein
LDKVVYFQDNFFSAGRTEIFSSPAFQLTNYSEQLSTEELIAVVMGVNAIHRNNSSNAAAAT